MAIEKYKEAVLAVTSTQVTLLVEPMGKTKALARVTLNDSMLLTGLRVVDGMNGLFVAYPNDPGYKGDAFRSLFYPVTRELRTHIEALLEEAGGSSFTDNTRRVFEADWASRVAIVGQPPGVKPPDGTDASTPS